MKLFWEEVEVSVIIGTLRVGVGLIVDVRETVMIFSEGVALTFDTKVTVVLPDLSMGVGDNEVWIAAD